MSYGFIRLPRDFLESDDWKNLKMRDQHVFLIILENAAFSPKKFNNNGDIIQLEPGDFCISERGLLELCSKELTYKTIRGCLSRLSSRNFISRNRAHGRAQQKMVIRITNPIVYETCFGGKKQEKGAARAQQGRTNKERKEREEIYINQQTNKHARAQQSAACGFCLSCENNMIDSNGIEVIESNETGNEKKIIEFPKKKKLKQNSTSSQPQTRNKPEENMNEKKDFIIFPSKKLEVALHKVSKDHIFKSLNEKGFSETEIQEAIKLAVDGGKKMVDPISYLAKIAENKKRERNNKIKEKNYGSSKPRLEGPPPIADRQTVFPIPEHLKEFFPKRTEPKVQKA